MFFLKKNLTTFFPFFLVPEVELKGETCNNYFLVQGDGCGGCKATLIYSANQINGSVSLAETIGKQTMKTEEAEESKSVFER